MIGFEEIRENIHRLKVPFENIYTAVFLVRTEEGYVLIDAAAGKNDVDAVILPALEAESIPLEEIKYLFCTHLHGDHGGGIRYILPYLRNAKVAAVGSRAIELYGADNVVTVKDGDTVCGLSVWHLPGHSADAAAIYDARSKTLISGDAVQLYGITRYGCGVGLPSMYKSSLARLCNADIEAIIASHEYYPLGSMACGKDVADYIREAENAFLRIEKFVRDNINCGDAAAIASAFTIEARSLEPMMPSLQSSTVSAILKDNT